MKTPAVPQRKPRPASRGRDAAVLLAIVGVAWAAQSAWQSHVASRAGRRIVALAQPGDIQMLSSETCVYCERARQWLTAQGVPFSECFVERDADCARRFEAAGAGGTPTLLVRGQRQLGFSPGAVAAALEDGAR